MNTARTTTITSDDVCSLVIPCTPFAPSSLQLIAAVLLLVTSWSCTQDGNEFEAEQQSGHMSDLVVAAGQMVAGAVVQEFVSRAVSFALGKRKEKASQGEYLERLQKAVHEVEFMQERTAKLAITEVSLLRQKIELKRQFMEAAACLLTSRRKKRQQETSQVVARSSSLHGLSPTSSGPMFSVSYFIATAKDELRLSCDDVERFERLAVSARSILTRVESGCSLRSSMNFSSPLVSHLFELKTLRYKAVQADQMRCFEVRPVRLEDRGVEAVVRYCYWDCIRPDKSFGVLLVLRLSESTDIVGIAIKCLQSMTSQFNLVADTTIEQLILLASNLQDISYLHAPPWDFSQEEHSKWTNAYRPYPLCCKGICYTPCADKVVVSSQISQAFPEEVIFFGFAYYISAPEYNLRTSADARGKRSIMRNRKRPHLSLNARVAPHYGHDDNRQQSSDAFEEIGDDGKKRPIDVSIQEIGETVRPRAINCFLRQPKVTAYTIWWLTKHGAAAFTVEKLNAGAQVPKWCVNC